MTQITISIDHDLEQKLRKFAKDNDYKTLSALVTDAIRDKIDNSKPDYWQRVSMVMQLENRRLLETLVGDKMSLNRAIWNAEETQDALMSGYAMDYRFLLGRIDRDELTDEEARSVHDTLATFRDLKWSAEQIGDKKLIERTQFPGFDARNDHKRFGYANFLVRNGKWPELGTNNEVPNSHGEQGDYEKLVMRHREIRNQKPEGSYQQVLLSRTDIDYILDGVS